MPFLKQTGKGLKSFPFEKIAPTLASLYLIIKCKYYQELGGGGEDGCVYLMVIIPKAIVNAIYFTTMYSLLGKKNPYSPPHQIKALQLCPSSLFSYQMCL